MRANRWQSRAVARRPVASAAAIAVTGAVLALVSAPAASAATSAKPDPHSVTASPTPKNGHGHKTTAHPGATKHNSTVSGTTQLQPRTATVSGTAAPTTVAPAAPVWVQPAVPAPAPAPAAASASAASAKPTTAPAHDASWQRDDPAHADRSVVHAFAADLKSAGQSAGFPALLIAVMIVFLLVQHRLDKRDVKLSHADWVSDHGLEFSAPATIQR